MTPAARHAAAIAVLDRWCDGLSVEQALTGWARSARYAGSGDRAAVRDHVFDVLRQRNTCAALGGGDDGRALILGLLRVQSIDPTTIFTGEGHAPTPLATHAAIAPDIPDDPLRDIPAWLHDALTQSLGDDLPGIAMAMRDRAPVYLRVNIRKSTQDQAIESLSSSGVAAQASAACATAIMVTDGARQIRQSDLYLAGLVEPQDLSVQMAVARIDWPDTGRILDYCAGGGGKTLAIAACSDGALTAHDANPRRMADLGPRAERAGVRVAVAETATLSRQQPWDVVLCDVPCSGSGTWRRDPEAKWRLTPEMLADLTATQDSILSDAARLVAPGGRLIYMTCSLLHMENMGRIAAFLAGHPDWHCTWHHQDTPLTASDGFFTAELARGQARH